MSCTCKHPVLKDRQIGIRMTVLFITGFILCGIPWLFIPLIMLEGQYTKPSCAVCGKPYPRG